MHISHFLLPLHVNPFLPWQVADHVLLSSLSLVFLCSNLSVIVAKVDGRGTGFRGDK